MKLCLPFWQVIIMCLGLILIYHYRNTLCLPTIITRVTSENISLTVQSEARDYEIIHLRSFVKEKVKKMPDAMNTITLINWYYNQLKSQFTNNINDFLLIPDLVCFP